MNTIQTLGKLDISGKGKNFLESINKKKITIEKELELHKHISENKCIICTKTIKALVDRSTKCEKCGNDQFHKICM